MARVILTLMIKNEERIVVRCIEHALRVADAVCVSDTGSTDGTLDVLASYFPALRVPTKLVHAPWADFGSNRNSSMLATVALCDELGWDRRQTYSLVLDADMLLRVSDEFDKAALTDGAYLVRQATASLSYYNVRLMRLSEPWRCVGVTHEYWESTSTEGSDPTVSLRTVHIDDVGDGGCKQDKFERDERVLRAALETDPANTRYMFYLAQTLRDVGKTEEAIEWYKRRAGAGQWRQEVWYSMYQLCKLYYKLRMMPEMELWGLKAHEYCGERAECLYALTRAFRIEAQYHKAWHYYELGRRVVRGRNGPSSVGLPSAAALFEEPAVYTRLFEYERTILAYYVLGPAKHGESLRDIVRYMNAHGTSETTWSNAEFYITRVPSVSVRALDFPPMGEYIASSVSVIRTPDGREADGREADGREADGREADGREADGREADEREEATSYLLNVRYVNYRIRPDGSYEVRGANGATGDGANDVPVRTRNFRVVCDADFREFGPLAEMKPDVTVPAVGAASVGAPQGLEDLRLYRDDDGQIKWVAASCEYSRDGTIQQVRGTYDATRLELRSATSMESASCKSCEKNWIPLGGAVLMDQAPRASPTSSFIYEWHPFTIGTCEADEETLVTRSTQETPPFFERLRGSSNVVEYDGALYAIAHLVCCGGRRRYYHVVVRLCREQLGLEQLGLEQLGLEQLGLEQLGLEQLGLEQLGPGTGPKEKATCAVEAYTMPFFFVEKKIEYCLGLEIKSGSLFAFVSQNDANPVVVEIELGALEFVAV
jgi:glycosyltransferase involved in cell wall biosynthesis